MWSQNLMFLTIPLFLFHSFEIGFKLQTKNGQVSNLWVISEGKPTNKQQQTVGESALCQNLDFALAYFGTKLSRRFCITCRKNLNFKNFSFTC